jgi:hypothetical protein
MCASIAFTVLWFEHSQLKLGSHEVLVVRCDWEIYRRPCGIILKKPAHLRAFSEHILHKTCGRLV